MQIYRSNKACTFWYRAFVQIVQNLCTNCTEPLYSQYKAYVLNTSDETTVSIAISQFIYLPFIRLTSYLFCRTDKPDKLANPQY